MTQILGISSSPVKKGNTETLLDHMMKTANKILKSEKCN